MIANGLRTLACGVLLSSATVAAAPIARPSFQDIPPPPNVFATLSEEQLVAQMTDRQRALLTPARNARERFWALTDVSELQLHEISAPTQPAAQGQTTTLALQLYEATIIAADRRLRSKEAAVRPRDRLFKRFEQRLTQQIRLLKNIVLEIGPEHVDAGKAASLTAKRLRLAALASAIDADPSILRNSEDEE
jgi:hypothetical protein